MTGLHPSLTPQGKTFSSKLVSQCGKRQRWARNHTDLQGAAITANFSMISIDNEAMMPLPEKANSNKCTSSMPNKKNSLHTLVNNSILAALHRRALLCFNLVYGNDSTYTVEDPQLNRNYKCVQWANWA